MFKLLLLFVLTHHSEAFLSSPSSSSSTFSYKHNNVVNKDTNNKVPTVLSHHHDDTTTITTSCSSTMSHDDITQRRGFLSKLTSTVTTMTGTIFMNPFYSHADGEIPTTTTTTTTTNRINTIEMKTFIDPKGLFAINVPKRYFAIRRTVKGDLPDEKTGQGRRGSSIFTAGDMAKAEVVAIERYVFILFFVVDDIILVM